MKYALFLKSSLNSDSSVYSNDNRMIEIFLFSLFILNSAFGIHANNLEWRQNVFPLELEVIIDLEAECLCNLI